MRPIHLLFGIILGSVVSGQATWWRTYGSFGSDQGESIRVGPDSSLVVLGSTGSFGAGAADLYLIALDQWGDPAWTTVIGGPGIEVPGILCPAPDDGWYLVGSTNSPPTAGGYDGLVVRVDGSGSVLWEHSFGREGWDFLHGGHAMPDGSLVVCGESTAPDGKKQAWLRKMSDSGDLVWDKFQGDDQHDLTANSIIPTTDGGFAYTGASSTGQGDEDLLMTKVDADGNVEWSITVGGDARDFGRDIIQTADGGYSIVGATQSFSSWTEGYHVRLNSTGSVMWQRNWGQINDQEAFGHIELPSGQFVTVGWTKTSGGGGRDIYIFFSDENGNFIQQRTKGGEADDMGYSIASYLHGFVLCGATLSFGSGGSDVFVVRTDSMGGPGTDPLISFFDPLTVSDLDMPSAAVNIYPNPTVDMLHFSSQGMVRHVLLYDLRGQILREWVDPGSTLHLPRVPAAQYLLRITNVDGSTVTVPVLIQPR